MKQYIKLFEEWVNEEDPLADLMGGGSSEPKEDPLEKKKKEEAEKKKKEAEKHEKFVDQKLEKVKSILSELPQVPDELRDKIVNAIEAQDRVKIHNLVLDITYLQQDYSEKGNDKMVSALSPLKDAIDDLDKSYTEDKMM
jgi:hypothetical protein